MKKYFFLLKIYLIAVLFATNHGLISNFNWIFNFAQTFCAASDQYHIFVLFFFCHFVHEFKEISRIDNGTSRLQNTQFNPETVKVASVWQIFHVSCKFKFLHLLHVCVALLRASADQAWYIVMLIDNCRRPLNFKKFTF